MGSLNRPHIVIVGGGFAGLSLAYFLQNNFEITLIESKSKLGGVVSSKFIDGYLLEYGPNTTRTTTELDSLIDSLNLSSQVISPPQEISKRKYLASSKTKITSTPSSLFEALSSPLLSPLEKLRILAEPFIRKGDNSKESVEEFISRRFGKGVSQKIIAAILSGIWAGDINKLEASSILEKLTQLELQQRSVILGAIKSKRPSYKPRIISFLGGMETLTNGLKNSLNQSRVLLDTTLVEAEFIDSKINVITSRDKIRADHLVLTQDSVSTSTALQKIAPEVSRTIQKISYSPIGILHLGFSNNAIRQPLDGFGFLVPPKYSSGLLGCIFNSAMFANRCPVDHSLLTVFWGGACFPEVADIRSEENLNSALQSLNQYLNICDAPKFIERSYIERAIPNYNLGHGDITSKVSDFEVSYPQISLLANWRKGISVADRISEAKQLADKLIKDITCS